MGRPTIVHRDLKLTQFILIDGAYKLNDFNCAAFLTWNEKRTEYCDTHSSHNTSAVSKDALNLCHILYQLFTGRHMSRPHFWHILVKGKHPTATDTALLKSNHPFDTLTLKALDMCWTFDLRGRPNVRELADLLRGALNISESTSSTRPLRYQNANSTARKKQMDAI